MATGRSTTDRFAPKQPALIAAAVAAMTVAVEFAPLAAVAQVIPPGTNLATGAPQAPPAPSYLPTAPPVLRLFPTSSDTVNGTVRVPPASDPLPQANRCLGRGTPLAFGVPKLHGPYSVALAAVVAQPAGGLLETFVRRQMAATQRAIDAYGDPEAIHREQVRLVKEANASVKPGATVQERLEGFERQVKDEQTIEAGIRAGKFPLPSTTGSFVCDGMTPGRFTVLVAVVSRTRLIRPGPYDGIETIRTTVYSADAEVPKGRGRRTVKVGPLHVLGVYEPSGKRGTSHDTPHGAPPDS